MNVNMTQIQRGCIILSFIMNVGINGIIALASPWNTVPKTAYPRRSSRQGLRPVATDGLIPVPLCKTVMLCQFVLEVH